MRGVYAVGRPSLTRRGEWMAAVLGCGPGAMLSHGREHDGIPVTSPVRTLIDQAARLHPLALERSVNEADKHDLVDPEELRAALPQYPGERGVGVLRTLLDRLTFRLSDSDLEIFFRPIARDAGLPPPETKQMVNGFEVDFYWPNLGLVIEVNS
jgi:hypothetical protein